MYIRWTGAGLLLALFALLALPAAYGVTRATITVTGSHDASLQLIAVAGMLLLFGGVAFLVGMLLNGRGGRHTLNGLPIQAGASVFPVVSLALLCVALGKATSGWVGGAAFLLVIVGLFQLGRLPNMIVEVGRTRDRSQLAWQHHWRWARRDAALRGRWLDDDGKPTYGRGAYGILAGEIDGTPFTAYDTFRIGAGGARLPLTWRMRSTAPCGSYTCRSPIPG